MPCDESKAVMGEFFACSFANLNFCVLHIGRRSMSGVIDEGCWLAQLDLCTD